MQVQCAADTANALSPGTLALILCVLVVCLWTFWGAAEMFHEGWTMATTAPVSFRGTV